jgi:hypothetical protein
MFKHKLWLLVSLAVILAWLCSPGKAETQYFFTYHWYHDNDTFSGYVYAPDGMFTVGSTITNQPNPMGGAVLGGYYHITGVTTGVSSSYDKQEYVTYYTTSGNGELDYNIYNDAGWNTTVNHTQYHSLYIADRSTTDEAHTGTYNGGATNYAYWWSPYSNTCLGSFNLDGTYPNQIYYY